MTSIRPRRRHQLYCIIVQCLSNDNQFSTHKSVEEDEAEKASSSFIYWPQYCNRRVHDGVHQLRFYYCYYHYSYRTATMCISIRFVEGVGGCLVGRSLFGMLSIVDNMMIWFLLLHSRIYLSLLC